MAPLTLTILGAGPAAPNVAGACSGYLVQEDGRAVLVDCGSGIAGRVVEHVRANRLGGVAISHFHPDHYFDLVPLYYLIKFDESGPPDLDRRVPLYVPPGGRAFLDQFGELIANKSAMFEDIFQICEYAPRRNFGIGGLTFSFHPVQHYILSHAMRIHGSSGATLVFSSDVGPCPELVDAARSADLFMCESALVDPVQDERDPTRRGHMSAGEAGAAARKAGAKRLMLTHYRSSEKWDAHHRAAAEAAFGGPVELAREGGQYRVG
ncbi:MAG TPA: MBL fold metallo-hydrolase [Chloroflexota bacterium]|jgi:ribonuclease BN (tRNA processing enzyme)